MSILNCMVLGPTAMDFNIKLRYGHFWNFQNKLHITRLSAQLRRGKGGSRGLPTMPLPAYKAPPFHKSLSHAAFQRNRLGGKQSALRSFAGKRQIQLDPRSHTIIDHMQS
ncbi:hypothetical protein AMECASPLE_038616 [Ameca splendens]|uniref:Uncharacterized protein n=1 Tax=Ameca splendens TaxID=208324 RepID=A0ABV0Y8T8_9TELE